MADQKITELNALATRAGEDVVPIVDDPSGSAETKKITVTNLLPVIQTGFDNTPDNATFTDTETIIYSLDITLAVTAKIFLHGTLDARTATNPATFFLILKRDTTTLTSGPIVHTHVANERSGASISYAGSLAAGTYNFRLYGDGGGQGATYTVGGGMLSVLTIE
jgi:hypothetical protein